VLSQPTRWLSVIGAAVVLLVLAGAPKVRGDVITQIPTPPITQISAKYTNVSTQVGTAVSPGSGGTDTFILRPEVKPFIPPSGITDIDPIGVQLLSYDSAMQRYSVSLFDPSMPTEHRVVVTTTGGTDTDFLFTGAEFATQLPGKDLMIFSGLTIASTSEPQFQASFALLGGNFMADVTGVTLKPPSLPPSGPLPHPTAVFDSSLSTTAATVTLTIVPEPGSLAVWATIAALGGAGAWRARQRGHPTRTLV
jgi:hypothetical protein